MHVCGSGKIHEPFVLIKLFSVSLYGMGCCTALPLAVTEVRRNAFTRSVLRISVVRKTAARVQDTRCNHETPAENVICSYVVNCIEHKDLYKMENC